MEDKLLSYYEKELSFIRTIGAEFAKKHPKIADNLELSADRCTDPHVERLIEAFAFISGRIHKKIDDDFPEVIEALLSIIYPHYLTIIPSMAIVKFEPNKAAIPPEGYEIKKKIELDSEAVSVRNTKIYCKFRTCYPVTIWPFEVTSAELVSPKKPIKGAQQALMIKLETFNNLSFSEIKWGKDQNLRFFLSGPSHHIYHLYELIFNNVCYIECESYNQEGTMESFSLKPENCILPVGFESEESILPYSGRSFPGYRLLFEYFCFPEKFLFFDLKGLHKMRHYEFGESLTIWIYLKTFARSDTVITKDTFCISATPVVNLFSKQTEPIRIEHKKIEYKVVPDYGRRDSTEIFSIDKVSSFLAGHPEDQFEFKPFYSVSHHSAEEKSPYQDNFWHMERRPSYREKDRGTEVYLSFTDAAFKPSDPQVENVLVYATCTNRDLPRLLTFGDSLSDFYPVKEAISAIKSIKKLVNPTATMRPFVESKKALLWRLISHLSLNYLSIIDRNGEALKELLMLYDFGDSPSTKQQINGIVKVEHQYTTKRIRQSFVRGIQVTVSFDENKYSGSGLFLFASVLERFLGQYVSLNSFSQMIAKSLQRNEIIKKWEPRNGNRVIL